MSRTLAAILVLGACTARAPQPAGGCWVHAFEGEEPYRAPLTTYTGPTHERFLMKDARSLMVGPGARLETPGLVLRAGARVPDTGALDAKVRGAPFQLVCEEP